MTDAQRASCVAAWNPYAGEGSALVREIVDRFRNEYDHLKGLAIRGPYIAQGGAWVISVTHPFIFDRRVLPSLPSSYLGVPVKVGVHPPLPSEFEGQTFPNAYVWAPPNFQRFVDRCGDQVRRELQRPEMTRDEMLHVLIGVPFDEHLARCREWVRQGKIPAFE